MSNPIMTAATETAVIVPEVWSQQQYETLSDLLIFWSSINHDYEGEIQDMGDTVNIHTVPDFSDADLLPEGAAGATEAVTITNLQLVINSRPYKDVIVTKQSQLQSLKFMDSLRDKMTYAIMKKIEALLVAASVPSASAPDHQIAYDSGSTLALADILEVKDLLDTALVPDADRIGGLNSAQYNDIFNITGFVSRDFIPAGSPLTSGKIETPVVGFELRKATTISTSSYWFHPSFMTGAIQEQLNIVESPLDSQGIRGTRINADLLMGYKQMDDERIVKLG